MEMLSKYYYNNCGTMVKRELEIRSVETLDDALGQQELIAQGQSLFPLRFLDRLKDMLILPML